MTTEQKTKNFVIIYIRNKKMDKLDNLLKEAKPLYFKRKRRKALACALVILAFPILLLNTAIQIYNEGNDIYVSLNNNTLQNELIEDDLGIFYK